MASAQGMKSSGRRLCLLLVLLACCLRLGCTARAESYKNDRTEEVTTAAQPDGRTWGDKFHDVSQILWRLDEAVFVVAFVLAVIVACWQPVQIVGGDVDSGAVHSRLKPKAWYSTLFASLTSHAAGIIGFVGFQKIVVARIVTTSQPDNPFALPNFLLYTSIAISMTAILASLVFLCVDYLRRLAIHSARSKGFRLLLKREKLESTGLGAALICLTAMLLVLYVSVIYTAAKKKEHAGNFSVVLEKVSSCATVLLYFFNLRALCESPKVQFHSTCDVVQKDVELKDFLAAEGERGHRSRARNCLAWFLSHLAGEDLGHFVKRGSRKAFLPQRADALVQVVCFLLLFGAIPCAFQFATEQLFVQPKLIDVKALSATLIPDFAPPSHRRWLPWSVQSQSMELGTKSRPYLLLLDPGVSRLTVTPKYQQTTSIRLCCQPSMQSWQPSMQNCSHHAFKHTLLEFDTDQAVMKIPVNSSASCTLTLLGLSSHATTELHFTAAVKSELHVCECSGEGCSCCDGYSGSLKSSVNVARDAQGSCVAAKCAVRNSNMQPGPDCRCAERHLGEIIWEGSKPYGRCDPAPCAIQNSTMLPAEKCNCADGYHGNIVWDLNSKSLTGICTSAPCSLENTTMEPGLDCRCADGFEGMVTWKGAIPSADCQPASCYVVGASGRGKQCKCHDGFAGNITWNGSVPKGSCEPAACKVKGSNGQSGPECKCGHGYQGTILWQGSVASGSCRALPCVPFDADDYREGRNFTGKPGPECRCEDGYNGTVEPTLRNGEWVMVADCYPVPCNVPNSDNVRGPSCKCGHGYVGEIHFNGITPVGQCHPAPCYLHNSNKKPGKECKCKDGFQGQITWKGTTPRGSCTPAECPIDESDHLPGPACQCLPGFFGKISWNGSEPVGKCLPLPVCSEHGIVVRAELAYPSSTCPAGQPVLVRGLPCDRTSIKWVSAQSLPGGNCQWNLTTSCGAPAPHYVSQLPRQCSLEPAQPRCSMQMKHTIRQVRNASEYGCPPNSQNTFLVFQGQQCGYDLIKWDIVAVGRYGDEDMKACNWTSSVGCGIAPPGEQLPTSCIPWTEPAFFEGRLAGAPDFFYYEVPERYKVYVRLFDTGIFTTETTSSDVAFRQQPQHWRLDNATYLLLNWASRNDKQERWVFGLSEADGSAFTGMKGMKIKTLNASGPLPLWWTFRFRDSASGFKADTLAGCQTTLHSKGVCYTIRFGEEVWQAPASDGDCLAAKTGTGTRYGYRSSAYGGQTYTSQETCLPTAAFRELLVQVVDAKVTQQGDATETSCRVTLRLTFDASAKAATCSKTYDTEDEEEEDDTEMIPSLFDD